MNDNYITPKEASKITGLHRETLRQYANKGMIDYIRIPNGDRRYNKESILTLIGKDKDKGIVFYIRSSDGKQSLLDSQEQLLRETYGEPLKIYKDKGSGLNEKRRGLQQLIKHAQKGNFTHIAITNHDRLTRFGYSYLETLFEQLGVEILVVNEKKGKDLYEELLEDFMSLLASFSGKFYRLRGWEQQKRLLKEVGEKIDEKSEKVISKTTL